MWMWEASKPVQQLLTKTTIARTALLMTLLALGNTGSLKAYDSSIQKAVNRAGNFLGTEERGQDVLSYIHFGTKYHGQKYLETRRVDEAGERFALVYEYYWGSDGVTDVAFLCTPDGSVYEVRILATNAVGNQPFLWANVSIQVLGNLVLSANRDKMTEADRRLVRKLVDSADAKSMLEWSLRFRQLLH
jgi:hypothetical protein